jgi:hypothetical protein
LKNVEKERNTKNIRMMKGESGGEGGMKKKRWIKEKKGIDKTEDSCYCNKKRSNLNIW